VLQPWVHLHVDFTNGPSSTVRGLADLTAGAGVQWAPIHLAGGVFASRFILDITAPTGRYDDRQPVNLGNLFVAVNPYYALTCPFRMRGRRIMRTTGIKTAQSTSPVPRLEFDANGRFESIRKEGAHRALLGGYPKTRLNRCVCPPAKAVKKSASVGKTDLTSRAYINEFWRGGKRCE
jgi:hypothetical protein